MNHSGVCRKAPATPGLFIMYAIKSLQKLIFLDQFYRKFSFQVPFNTALEDTTIIIDLINSLRDQTSEVTLRWQV